MTVRQFQPILSKASWITALSLTVAAILLHLFSLSVVGALWRDEIGLANISLLPTWKEIVWGLMHDHCPVVFPAVVRSWSALGLAHSDTGLRILGLGIGLLVLSSFWAATRMMDKGLPLLSLAFVAVNPVVIRYGDSIRGYGLGIALILLTMGLIWRFVERPGVGRGLLAGMAAVVSVQTLYQNAFFLLAICLAGVAVSIRQRQPAKAAGILGMGFVAALSLLPYVGPIRKAQSWWVVSQSGTSLKISFKLLSLLFGHAAWLWLAVGVIVLAAALGIGRVLVAKPMEQTDVQVDLPLYGAITLVLGGAGFWVFIKLTGLPTQVWYYIPAFCFLVLCCDAVLPRVFRVTTIGVLSIAIVALLLSSSGYAALRWRQTDGDLIAAQVSKDARPGDLVVVHPWYFGLTFARYYHGAAKWTTLPPISDYRFHRYDLIKEKLAMTNAITPVLQQVETTLRSGNCVWVVGGIPVLPPAAAMPTNPPPAPKGPLGWSDRPYSDAWGSQLGYILEHHITNATCLVDPATNAIPINPMERMTLTVTSGWRTPAGTNSP